MPESASTVDRPLAEAVDESGLRVAVSPYLFRSMLVAMAGVAIAIHRTTGSRALAWQFAKAQRVAPTQFVSMQNHYNLVYREEEREMIPQCIDQGIAILPWSPLARGLLAGNRTREGERLTTRARTDEWGENLYTPEVDFAVVDRVSEVASARGVPQAQVALAWLLHRPGVTAPIVGATKPEHLDDAIAAERLQLSTDEMVTLQEAYVPHAVSGH